MSASARYFVLLALCIGGAAASACGSDDETGLFEAGGDRDGGGGDVGGSGAQGGAGGGSGGEAATDAGAGGSAVDASEDASGGSAGAVSVGGAAGAGGCAEPVRYYADADNDGRGDPKAPKDACEPPAGYVTSSDDCYDGNEQANPDQVGWFATDRGDGSYDYDCDGKPSPRYTTVGGCGVACVLVEGWDQTAAQCGQAGVWITGCSGFPGFCQPGSEARVQECH